MKYWDAVTKTVAFIEANKDMIPHLNRVHARHSMPIRNADLAAGLVGLVTVYWDAESIASRQMGRGNSGVELTIRALIFTPERDATGDALLSELYDGNETLRGLKRVLLDYPKGLGFAFDPAEARPIEPEETTQGRFSAGLQIRAVCRAIG